MRRSTTYSLRQCYVELSLPKCTYCLTLTSLNRRCTAQCLFYPAPKMEPQSPRPPPVPKRVQHNLTSSSSIADDAGSTANFAQTAPAGSLRDAIRLAQAGSPSLGGSGSVKALLLPRAASNPSLNLLGDKLPLAEQNLESPKSPKGKISHRKPASNATAKVNPKYRPDDSKAVC